MLREAKDRIMVVVQNTSDVGQNIPLVLMSMLLYLLTAVDLIIFTVVI